jgi:UDP-glucose 4-epimerase
MNILVTGGAGFIGSHLVERLVLDGHNVVVLDNLSTGRLQNLDLVIDKIQFINCNIAEAGSWATAFNGIDWVFHLAALADIVPSIQMPDAYFDANVNGTYNVLRASQSSKVSRFVYSASSSCYGVPKIYPTPEDAEIKPQYPYALTKRIGEELVLHWADVYKLPALSMRFFNVYGPKSRTSGTYGAVFGVFLAQKLAGKPFTIVGTGDQTRDFTYVTDIVEALLKASQSNFVGMALNVGSGSSVSVNQVVNLLGGDKVFIPKRPGEPDMTYANIEKIQKLLGWNPQISIEVGIKNMLLNIDYWKDAPVWTPMSIEKATSDWFKYLGAS